MAQCIRKPLRLGWDVDFTKEEGGDPTRHPEMEEISRSRTVERSGFERRRWICEPFAGCGCFVASCSFCIKSLRWYYQELVPCFCSRLVAHRQCRYFCSRTGSNLSLVGKKPHDIHIHLAVAAEVLPAVGAPGDPTDYLLGSSSSSIGNFTMIA